MKKLKILPILLLAPTLLAATSVTADDSSRTSLEDQDYTVIGLASGKTGNYSGKFNEDVLPGGLQDTEVTLAKEQTLEGHPDLGTRVTVDKTLYDGTLLRFDTPRSAEDATAEGVFEFKYVVTNYSEDEVLKLDTYQINSSTEYKSSFAYEDRYRIDMDLQPGETKEFVGQYEIGTNKNWLTIMIVDEDSNGIDYGVSMGYKKVEAIDKAYTGQEKEVEGEATISYKLPAGITISGDYAKTQTDGRLIAAPTAEQITNNTPLDIVSWYDVDTGVEIGKAIAHENVTIAPMFDKSDRINFFGRSNNDTRLGDPDYIGSVTDEKFASFETEDVAAFREKLSTSSIIANGEEANEIKYDGVIAADTALRYLTKVSKINDNDTHGVMPGSYRIDFTLTNLGEDVLSLRLYQILSSTTLSGAGTDSQDVVIEPNTTKNVSLYITLTSGNNNLITFIHFLNEVTNLDLAVSLGLTAIASVPTSAFATEATKTSMIVDYNYNDGDIQINSAKLRFGAILDKELFAKATEYDVGVIMAPSYDMLNTTFNAYLDLAEYKTVDGVKSLIPTAYSYSLKENMATVNYDEGTGTTVTAEDGAYYQFAAVVNGFENYLDQSITSAVYVVVDGTLSILDEATYSISSLAARYVAEGFTGHQELLEFLKNA